MMNWRAVWKELRCRRAAMVGLGIMVTLGSMAVLADFIASDLPLLLHFHAQDLFSSCWFSVQHPYGLMTINGWKGKCSPRKVIGLGGLFCEYGPEQQPEITRDPPASPDRTHWLGTDDRGRDVLADWSMVLAFLLAWASSLSFLCLIRPYGRNARWIFWRLDRCCCFPSHRNWAHLPSFFPHFGNNGPARKDLPFYHGFGTRVDPLDHCGALGSR